VRLALAVPSGAADTARSAASDAGWTDDLVDVIEVAL
jgi:hypothetical protein